MKNQNGFTVVELLLLVVVVAVIGFAGYFVYSQQSETKSNGSINTSTNNGSAGDNNDKQQNTLTKTTYKNEEGKQLSVQHPSSWEVVNYTRGEGPAEVARPATSIKSAKGNYLHLWSPDGLGGDCGGPNDVRYTLVKRIPTQIKNVFFSEYNVDDAKYPVDELSVEQYYDSTSLEHKNLKEGQSNTDTCTNGIGYYSTANGIYISIRRESKPNTLSNIPYADLRSDTEFIEMLSTLNDK